MNVVAMNTTRATTSQTSHKGMLAELHARRRDLISQMNDLQVTINKVQNAPRDEADVRAEIAGLDGKERQAAHHWAEQGASGEPPAVDMETRVALNDKLAAAVAKTAANTAALGALNAKQNGFGQQINALNQPIAIAANNVMIDKLAADVAAARDLIDKLAPLVASIDSGRLVIVAENHRITEAGGGHGAHELFHRVAAIPGTRDIFTTGDPAKSYYSDWLSELEALKRGE
jgi:hypothetical protein